VLPAERAALLGISGPALRADGDVHDRLLQWLTEAWAALNGAAGPGGSRGDQVGGRTASQALIEAIPRLVIGQELAGARLIIASLDPDVADRDVAGAVARPAVAQHG
jgi:NADH:ubiquinone oxidoreductase subunit D